MNPPLMPTLSDTHVGPHPATLYRVREVADIFVDACVRHPASGELLLLSIYGRDTALLEFFAAFSLPKTQGGLDQFTLTGPDDKPVTVLVSNANKLKKLAGKLPKGNLFGQVGHAWLYDPALAGPDRANRTAWGLYRVAGASTTVPGSDRSSVTDRLWQQVRDLSPLPLHDGWRDRVLTMAEQQRFVKWLDGPDSSFRPLGDIIGCRIELGDSFIEAIADLVRTGQLGVVEAQTFRSDPPVTSAGPSLAVPVAGSLSETCPGVTAVDSTEDAHGSKGDDDEDVSGDPSTVEVRRRAKLPLALGQNVTTPGVEQSIPLNYAYACLRRHQLGDWGVLCASDVRQNDRALLSGQERILSAYPIDPSQPCEAKDGSNCFWIITEWDRSVTTMLLPSEY